MDAELKAKSPASPSTFLKTTLFMLLVEFAEFVMFTS